MTSNERPLMTEELKEFLRNNNRLHPTIRMCGLIDKFRLISIDAIMLGIMTTTDAVIPGETRYSCQVCGECCRNPKVKLPENLLDTEKKQCKNLVGNKCSIDAFKPSFCRVYPFRIIDFGHRGKLLFIDVHCRGNNVGELITNERYLKIRSEMERPENERGQTRDL